MPTFRPGPVRVRAPATSANLGPGFDALGLALALYDDVTIITTPDDDIRVEVTGEGSGELPTDGRHLVARAVRACLDQLGAPAVGLRLTCHNRIPQARGLGSSSAAIVAGVLAGRALVDGGAGRLDDAGLLELAAELEGHPDNVAPCLLGGFTIAWCEGGRARAVTLSPDRRVHPVLLVPEQRGLTAAARAALPHAVPHADAAFTAGRAALLVHALTAAPQLLLEATEDRLHQRYRAAGMPDTAAVVDSLRATGLAAVVSGAGPSVLALPASDQQVTAPTGWTVLRPQVDMSGARIE